MRRETVHCDPENNFLDSDTYWHFTLLAPGAGSAVRMERDDKLNTSSHCYDHSADTIQPSDPGGVYQEYNPSPRVPWGPQMATPWRMHWDYFLCSYLVSAWFCGSRYISNLAITVSDYVSMDVIHIQLMFQVCQCSLLLDIHIIICPVVAACMCSLILANTASGNSWNFLRFPGDWGKDFHPHSHISL